MSIRDQERWKRVQELFLAASELPEAERPDFLGRASEGDQRLASEVARLLALEEKTGRGIESVIEGGAALLVEPPVSVYSGQRFGAYRLIRELGKGGMGVVYLAERADQQFDKRVALKLIRPASGSAGLVRRFRRERQILAGLEHPAIAQLLDGGSGEDGSPFLVMEYVEGTPIDEYCQQQSLGLRERLRLFSDVCLAVSHAHRNLVVHRDLKPVNILVTSEGKVKLLDFGIAKLLEPDGSESGPEPTLTAGLMTPQYASPEQVEGGPISTASDIYSLGLLLYELLAGERPYQLSGRPLSEVQRLVCEQDPEAPSVTLSARPGVSGRISPKRLSGDLDAIVMKTLRKEPPQRYSSVERLSLDIERYLEGHPVAARRGGWAYRASKFMRRNRPAIAAALVFITLSVGFIGQVVKERNAAQEERKTAERALDLVISLVDSSKPSGERRRRSAMELFNRNISQFATQLQTQPRQRAKLLDAVGRLYLKLNQYEQAQSFLGEALDKRRELARSRNLLQRRRPGALADMAESQYNMAALLEERAQREESKALLQKGLDIYRQLGGSYSLETAEGLTNIGNILTDEGSYESAIDHHQEALKLREGVLGKDHVLVAESLSNLSLDLQYQGAYEAAEKHLRRAVELYRQRFGDDDPEYAAALSNLGHSLSIVGNYEEARDLLNEAVKIGRSFVDKSDVAQYLDNLAKVEAHLGHHDLAEKYYLEALGMRREIFGKEEHPDYAQSLNNMALFLLRYGKYQDAEKHLRRAQQLRETLGNKREVARVLSSLAMALQRRGAFVEGEALLRRSLTIRQRIDGEGSPGSAVVQTNLGAMLYQRGVYGEAESYLREALEAFQALSQEEGSATTRSLLGAVLTAQGKLVEAESQLKEALRILEKSDYKTPSMPVAQKRLADVLAQSGAWEEAEKLYSESLNLHRKLPGFDVLEAETLVGLGNLLNETDRPSMAEEILRDSLRIFLRELDADHWQVAQAEGLLGECLMDRRKLEEAETLLRSAYEKLSEQENRSREAKQIQAQLDSLDLARRTTC